MKRVRTKHFFLSGAIGGLVGFLLMELVRTLVTGEAGGVAIILASALRFAAFGVAVGAALGMTEGLVQKKSRRLYYGLFLGVVLGLIGGFGGGTVGEVIFQLLPRKPAPEQPGVDLAIALDASGSMKQELLFGLYRQGNDLEGKRLKAAQKIVDMLGPRDRVAIVSFNQWAQVHLPLTRLDSQRARDEAQRAILAVGNSGFTSLTAGLQAALGELTKESTDQRQNLIFLTDGEGDFQEAVIQPALDHDIKIYTIGLGAEVDENTLRGIAKDTGGAYYSVNDADKLGKTFETIYKEDIQVTGMTEQSEKDQYDPFLLLVFRMLSWGAMGLVIGLGQGVRENTREDLPACTLGGLIGGLVGGALFDPIVSTFALGGGAVGRILADVAVGACIGGSMRFAQDLVVKQDRPTRTLITFLPEKESSLVMQPERPAQPRPGGQLRATGFKGLVLSVKEGIEQDGGTAPRAAAPSPSPASDPVQDVPRPAPTGRRKPLSFFKSRYPENRHQAMVAAFESGHYTVAEVSEFFEVPEARVRRAIDQSR